MPLPPHPPLSILIDNLTNSIRHTISGDSQPTVVTALSKADLPAIRKKQGWNFAWATEFQQPDRTVYKLTLAGQPATIQGLVSLSNMAGYYYLHLIESAPINLGRMKLYEGVPGNLVAFACKLAWDAGDEGAVTFQAKTKLITHYEATLGATHIGGHRMIIYLLAALHLIHRYFPQL